MVDPELDVFYLIKEIKCFKGISQQIQKYKPVTNSFNSSDFID